MLSIFSKYTHATMLQQIHSQRSSIISKFKQSTNQIIISLNAVLLLNYQSKKKVKKIQIPSPLRFRYSHIFSNFTIPANH